MIGKYLLIVIFGFVVVSVLLVYVFQNESETTITELPKKSLSIKVPHWPPLNILFVAQEKGIFDKNGVDVEFDLQEYGTESMSDYAQNFDGIEGTYPDIFTMNAIYDPSLVVYVSDFSNNGDFIISNFDSLEKLKGKRVGVTEMYGFSYFFVLKALNDVGLNENNVELISVPISGVLSALKSGEIDAAHTWDFSILAEPDLFVIATAGDYPGIISNVIAFKQSTIDQNPHAIEALVLSYVEAAEYCESNKSECVRIISENIGWTEKDVLNHLNSVQLLNLEDNFEIMTNFENPESLYVSGKFISESLYELNQLTKIPNYEETVDEQFVRKLKEIT